MALFDDIGALFRIDSVYSVFGALTFVDYSEPTMPQRRWNWYQESDILLFVIVSFWPIVCLSLPLLTRRQFHGNVHNKVCRNDRDLLCIPFV